jgi:hypothetical protein
MRGLFITHEGFGNSIFRSQVIEHCESLITDNIEIDILTYDVFRKSWDVSLGNVSKYVKNSILKINLKKAFNIYLPGSSFLNIVLLALDIRQYKIKRNISFIHARADYTAFLCVLLKPLHQLPVIWDCRGDSIDEMNFAIEKYNFIVRNLFVVLFVWRQRFIKFIAAKYSNSCVCVSEPLRSSIVQIRPNLKIYVIPCPVPTAKFFYSHELRNRTREKLGVTKAEVLYIYSGSMTGYQSMEKFIWYYKAILEKINTKIIILTIDEVLAKLIFKDIISDRLLIKTGKYEEMNSFYCAADFAMMIRESRALNFVASPTKFGEYCLAGLSVVHNDTVHQVTEVTKVLGNGCGMNLDEHSLLSNEHKIDISRNSKKIYGRDFSNVVYKDLYKSLGVK